MRARESFPTSNLGCGGFFFCLPPFVGCVRGSSRRAGEAVRESVLGGKRGAPLLFFFFLTLADESCAETPQGVPD